MNKQRKDVLNILYRHSVTNQREISELSGHSLGVVNKSIKELMNQGYRIQRKSAKECGDSCSRIWYANGAY